MSEYRDPLGALLERISQLEKQLAEARQPAGEALRVEDELLGIEAAWRERREKLRGREERRRRRVRIASTILFFLMCAGSIAAMAAGQVPFGLFFFVASVTGWALAGLQNGRSAVLLEAYEEDRLRVERALAQLRRALPRVRILVGEGEAHVEEEPVDVTGEQELAAKIERVAR